MRVRFIKAQDTHALRLKVLRPGGLLEDVDFANDRLVGAFHLGLQIGEHRISVGSFYPEPHPELNGWKQFRLRGMATHPDFQGQGAGARLLRFALEHLKAQHADLLWCNARVKAVPFYERAGLAVHGERFEIPGIGGHYVMYRRL
ncbi:MAG: GNAT family N-acetyltransferase [Flavobacteriales bacterium]|nr:GNAT family N-acetyltransferase [Flavobacteriales bacterium]